MSFRHHCKITALEMRLCGQVSLYGPPGCAGRLDSDLKTCRVQRETREVYTSVCRKASRGELPANVDKIILGVKGKDVLVQFASE